MADKPTDKTKTVEEPKAKEPKAEEPEQKAPAGAPAAPAGTDPSGRQLYNVTCAECGKPAQVPFKPSGDRPVYCKDCYMKQRGSR